MSANSTSSSVGSSWGLPKIRGTFLGGPYNKHYSIMGFILGSPILGNYQMFLWAYEEFRVSRGIEFRV